MTLAAERTQVTRNKRLAGRIREIRLTVSNARSEAVRASIAEQIKALHAADEEEAMRWIEAVSEFDDNAARWCGRRCSSGD